MSDKFENSNNVLVTFNDGSTVDASGCSGGILPHDVIEDFKWIGFTLSGYIRDARKSQKDIKKIEVTINYKENYKELVECPECMENVRQEELDMFGGWCEVCTEEM